MGIRLAFMGSNMRIIHDLDEITETARGWLAGGPVGFIPTMGYLHAGHAALIQAARQECEYSIVSIFVNPLQFGVNEDPTLYPRDLARDMQFLAAEQVDVVFLPRVEDMYPPHFSTYVIPSGPVAERLEGVFRPVHMRGYATIITKLLQLVRPDVAYFSQKNAQHVALIHQLVRDLNIDVKVRVLPAVRDVDGLAMGSYNDLLSSQERQAALLVYQALLTAKALLEQGERRLAFIEQAMVNVTAVTPLLKVEYATACDPSTFEFPGDILPDNPANLLLVIAARIGALRLTDNILLRDGHWQI
ncbi:MAG: pantoate--beta-alanine ligase [Ktedonobacteraceae bacterium]